jgi:anti-sigma factor RsiW
MTREDELRLHAYLDGELGATEAVEFERRMAEDSELRSGLAELRAIGERIRTQARYHEAPSQLWVQVASRVRRETPGRRGRLVWWTSLVAAGALAAVVAWVAPPLMHPSGQWEPRAEQVLDDHLRAQLTSHWIDVASSDRHTVKPWLSARLGFSPSVPDLSDQGFELIGARLDVLDAKPVAVLVYQRRQHLISVFVWPGDPVVAPGTAERRGYHVVRWVTGDLSYWAVSDLNENELRDFARLLSSPP